MKKKNVWGFLFCLGKKKVSYCFLHDNTQPHITPYTLSDYSYWIHCSPPHWLYSGPYTLKKSLCELQFKDDHDVRKNVCDYHLHCNNTVLQCVVCTGKNVSQSTWSVWKNIVMFQ
jgi:hypothetical protein